MILRVFVGYHFFYEGTSKLRAPNWTSEHFLRGAKGPLTPMFHQMLDDPDGQLRLCAKQIETPEGESKWVVDSQLTELVWANFVDAAIDHYGFNSQELVDELQTRREATRQQIESARSSGSSGVDTRELERIRKNDELAILSIRTQAKRAKSILESHQAELVDWLSFNKTELLAHYKTQDRLIGFERDGVNRGQVAQEVDSIRGQLDSVVSDRKKKTAQWYGEIKTMWDSLESQINGLAVGPQIEKESLALHRPFDQPASALKIIDRVIPWFDTIVGALLILGLFTRFASLSAGLFLASVVASQAPWVAGAKPTFYETVELLALFVIFATCAGRYGGLDFFFSQPSNTQSTAEASE